MKLHTKNDVDFGIFGAAAKGISMLRFIKTC